MTAQRSVPLLLALCLVAAVVGATTPSAVSRRRRADDLGAVEAVVEHLSQQVNSLTQQVSSLTSQVTVLTTKTETLDRTVAFYVWHNNNPLRALTQSTLIFNHVATNVGNAYDSDTGMFTAPLAGLYDFQTSIMGSDISHQGYVVVGIMVDADEVARSLSDNRHGANFDQASIRAVVHINAGAKVFVKNVNSRDGSFYVSSSEVYTTFCGFLIKAD